MPNLSIERTFQSLLRSLWPAAHVERQVPRATARAMLSTTCHCGAVTIEIPRRPRSLTDCDCSICRRYGTLWAYYKTTEVRVTAQPGATSSYAWGRKTLSFVRCNTCGCVTHWEPTAPERGPRMGVNARNFEPAQLGRVRIRLLDGAVTERYVA
jgi:hypothetical protein